MAEMELLLHKGETQKKKQVDMCSTIASWTERDKPYLGELMVHILGLFSPIRISLAWLTLWDGIPRITMTRKTIFYYSILYDLCFN